MAKLCVIRFKGGACLIRDVIEEHVPEVGKSLPDAYREGLEEIVIGVFDDSTQTGRLLGIIQRIDDFISDSDRPCIDALMDLVREMGQHDNNAAKAQGS